MRIVAGRLSGRSLATPKGHDIRPTTDRTRESLFNILNHGLSFNFEGKRVLDLFAGTGALGFEALSRGAKAGVFVEQSVEGRGLIQKNIEEFALTGSARILRRDATQLGEIGTMQPFHLVFADPPYGKGLGEKAFVSAMEGGWLHNDAIIVLEETKEAIVSLPANFRLVDERGYGNTVIRLYEFMQIS